MTTDDGSAPLELVLGVAVLVLPMAVLVASLPQWLEAHQVAADAARQGARIAVLEPSMDDSEIAARVRSRLDTSAAVDIDRTPAGATVTVTVAVPLLPLWDRRAAAYTIAATHAELVDTYRSVP